MIQGIVLDSNTYVIKPGNAQDVNCSIVPSNECAGLIFSVQDANIVDLVLNKSVVPSQEEEASVCCAYDKLGSDYAPGSYLFDDNVDTMWHSDWENHAYGHEPDGKHWVDVIFNELKSISGFDYFPRKGSSAGVVNGKWIKFNVLVYNEADELIHTEAGSFTYTDMRSDSNVKHFVFANNVVFVGVKHIRIEITEAGNNNTDGKKFASGAELQFIEVTSIQLQSKTEGSTIITVGTVDGSTSATSDINVTTSRESVEADYNSHDRSIVWKLDIYFDGINNEPLSITRDNYLIDAELLEETSADSKDPFGSVSSNELSFSLFNENGMFSPTTATGMYYGKIKTGVPIVAHMKPEEEGVDIEYDKLGVFYVTDWNAAITGVTADVTANDLMYMIFNLPQVKLPVKMNTTVSQLYKDFFDALGIQVSIDADLNEELEYAYNVDDNKTFLNNISIGSQSYIFCNREGVPRVEYARGLQEVAHELTDNDQVVDIKSTQSVLLEYSGAEVVMNKPQESDPVSLLSINELKVPAGKYTSTLTAFSKKPVYKLTSIELKGDKSLSVSSIVATCLDVLYEIENTTGAEVTNKFEIIGTFIDVVSSTYSFGEGSMLSVDNIYIQSEEYAQKFLTFLKAYVVNKVPVLELEIRGNPKYLPGEKLHIVSEKYNVDFTGILIRQQFKYDGGLSSTIKVFNSEIMEVL